MVRAVEWEKDPDPVPRYTEGFQHIVHAIENRRSKFPGGVGEGDIGSILSDHDDQRWSRSQIGTTACSRRKNTCRAFLSVRRSDYVRGKTARGGLAEDYMVSEKRQRKGGNPTCLYDI